MSVSEARVIDGKKWSQTTREELTAEVSALRAKYPHIAPPCLAVVLVGERKDSQTYVRMKTKACEEVGITSDQRNLPADITEEALLSVIKELNENPVVNGILVQLPLPKHINEDRIIKAIDPNKDADGLHQSNLGCLLQLGSKARLIPCTPKGCLELLDRERIPIEGRTAVVIGRSNLVGKPVALLLLSRNATVTVCHSRTPNLEDVVRNADIVVAAVGRAHLVKGSWLKPGAVVIDVGINAIDDPSKKAGYRLVGDVAYDEAKTIASAITPVPGGVGPMTVAMLLTNTVTIYKDTNNMSL